MNGQWAPEPYTIHVNGDPSALEDAATAAGASVLHWSLAGIKDQRELDASAADVFEFPFPSAGQAGLIDMLSDLEWLEVENGALMVIDADRADDSVTEVVAGLLPGIVDRWRSGTAPFEVFLVNVVNPGSIAEVLERKNARLDESGSQPWSRPDIYRVPVVIHSD